MWAPSSKEPFAPRPGGYWGFYTVNARRVEQKAQSQMRDTSRSGVSARVARCCDEWASEELNLGPHAYQACALTT
jgi:hypothetical protein